MENSVSADPESVAKADDYLHEVECIEFLNTKNADPAVPESIPNFNSELIEIDSRELISEEGTNSDEELKGNAFATMAAEMMRKSLAKQGIFVPEFSAD